MPLITVTFSSQDSRLASKATIAAEVNRLSATFLNNDPKVTAIIVQRVEPEDWFAGGNSLAEQGLASVWLDVHVTEGNKPRTRKPGSSPKRSGRWASCSGPCTKKATFTSTRSAVTPTVSVASRRSGATSPPSSACPPQLKPSPRTAARTRPTITTAAASLSTLPEQLGRVGSRLGRR